MNNRTNVYSLLMAILLLIFLCNCSNDQLVYAYVVTKPIPEQNDVDTWRPVMRVTFRVGKNKVVTEVASLMDEYNDCTIQNKNNWQCQYVDGTGNNTFGFVDGKYWKDPGWGDDIKYVSRWEYNLIRCKWHQFESGKFKGTASCLQTFI